jgi:hypothetical protein
MWGKNNVKSKSEIGVQFLKTQMMWTTVEIWKILKIISKFQLTGI